MPACKASTPLPWCELAMRSETHSACWVANVITKGRGKRFGFFAKFLQGRGGEKSQGVEELENLRVHEQQMDSRLGDCAEISAGREKQTQEADAAKGEIVRTWGPRHGGLDPYEEGPKSTG